MTHARRENCKWSASRSSLRSASLTGQEKRHFSEAASLVILRGLPCVDNEEGRDKPPPPSVRNYVQGPKAPTQEGDVCCSCNAIINRRLARTC